MFLWWIVRIQTDTRVHWNTFKHSRQPRRSSMSPVSKTWEKRLISVSLCISDRIFISPDVAYESAGIKPLSSLLIPVVLLLVCAALWMMWSGSYLHLYMFISTAVTFNIFAGEIRSFRYEIHAIGNFATQISLGLVGQTYSLITNRKLVWKTIVFHTALLCYGRPEFESRLETFPDPAPISLSCFTSCQFWSVLS